MATFDWQGFMGGGPAWGTLGANTIVFSASLTDLATAITVGEFQDGTHAGSNDPGTDQCGANHMNNVKFISSGSYALNGGATELLNDTNLLADECTLKVIFSHGSAVVTSNARFYCFDGVTETDFAPGLDVYAFERGVGATTWTEINDASAGQGGDTVGVRLALGDQGSATDHDFYLAISASPESVGAKAAFDFGIALTYS
jgi:hypothetical protein